MAKLGFSLKTNKYYSCFRFLIIIFSKSTKQEEPGTTPSSYQRNLNL